VGRFARHFASWIGWNFATILAVFVFIPKANFKVFAVIVARGAQLVPGFTYWDLIMPFYMLFFFWSWWKLLRPRALKGHDKIH